MGAAALAAALLLGGPIPLERCATCCWPTEPLRCYYVQRPRCDVNETACSELPRGSICTPEVVNLGTWEPRPLEWPREFTLPQPLPPPPVPAP